MRIYVSGPMTGIPFKNKEAFIRAAKQLRDYGYSVVNPWELDQCYVRNTWEDCMRRDIVAMMDCDAIAMLPGFEYSRGAMLELDIADRLGFKVGTVKHYLKRRPTCRISKKA